MSSADAPKATSTDSATQENEKEPETSTEPDMLVAPAVPVHDMLDVIRAAFTKDMTAPQTSDAAEVWTTAKDVLGELAGAVFGAEEEQNGQKTSRFSQLRKKSRTLLIKSLYLIERYNKEKTGPDEIHPVIRKELQDDRDINKGQLGNPDAANGRDGDIDHIYSMMDAIENFIDRYPDLAESVSMHSLFTRISAPKRKRKEDPITTEIRKKVTILWSDRKKTEHHGAPWTKNAAAYITCILAEWYEAGVLKKTHLNAIPGLYGAYSSLISLYPEKDLQLETSPGGRPSLKALDSKDERPRPATGLGRRRPS